MVASLAEAWIEMQWNIYEMVGNLWSPPSRRRGLKSAACQRKSRSSGVASLAEAWIEIGVYK